MTATTVGDNVSAFLWDRLSLHLLSIYQESWAKLYSEMTARTEVAVMFSKRVEHRTIALSLLFGSGLYDQSVALVRAAYEDWLQTGFILCLTLPADVSRAEQYRADVAKTEAQLYKAFGALAGHEAREVHMADPPAEILALVDKSNAELRVSGHWAQKADALGLRAVHDFVHPYLSELSHGNMRNYPYLFVNDDEASQMAPVPLERDEDAEQPLAMWAWWFQLRTLTICARERGLDFEAQSSELLTELHAQGKHLGLETACFCREVCGPAN